MRSFSGAVAAITGASGGLGRAFAKRFGAAGARLALLDVDAAGAAALAEALRDEGIEAIGLGCDVTDAAACAAAFAQVEEKLGDVDVLFNNAGITHSSFFADTDVEVIKRVVRVNLFGAIHCTKAALPGLLRRRGLIVAISSMAGLGPLDGRTGYSASKHALHGLFDSLRSELRDSGVQVLLVCPTFVDTGIGAAALGADGKPAGRSQATVGKVATPEEIAEAVYHAARRGQRLLVPSAVGKLSRWMHFFWPALYERMMSRSVRAELRR